LSSKSYLSIGDVLTLLRAEFPDITISKIRFLESQGLVNPQRSPSGYRKFYEEDVERLRIVLRQQRDEFLPLKVIRDRLNGEDSAGEELGDGPGEDDRDAPLAKVIAMASVEEEVVIPPSEGHPASQSRSSSSQAADSAVERPSSVSGPAMDVASAIASLQEAPTGTRPMAQTPRAPRRRRTASTTPSLAEAAAISSLSEADIESLASFGIVATTTIAGERYLAEDTEVILSIAERFAAHGIEPRHLRQFKNAVDREVGLFEQLIAPLLRQRNPESRKRAEELVGELTELAASLHNELLARQIGTFFGGSN
jgi:DNA-binding transcriptional MerR regulator